MAWVKSCSRTSCWIYSLTMLTVAASLVVEPYHHLLHLVFIILCKIFPHTISLFALESSPREIRTTDGRDQSSQCNVNHVLLLARWALAVWPVYSIRSAFGRDGIQAYRKTHTYTHDGWPFPVEATRDWNGVSPTDQFFFVFFVQKCMSEGVTLPMCLWL